MRARWRSRRGARIRSRDSAASSRRHQRVARDLGDDRGGGDRQRQRVAADDRARRAARPSGTSRPSTSAKSARRLSALTARAIAQKRRAADVERVDLRDAGEGDRDASRLGVDDFAQRLAPRRAQRLRIVEPFGQVVGIENHRGDADRPGERAAADLVDAGDAASSRARSARARKRSRARPLFSRSGPCRAGRGRTPRRRAAGR